MNEWIELYQGRVLADVTMGSGVGLAFPKKREK